MRVAVFGAGAIGGFFGGRLAASGADVTLIARGGTLTALHEHGLRIDGPDGDSLVLDRLSVTDDPATVGPVEFVIVAVKAWQVGEAARAMRPLVGPASAVLPLQNGVEAAGQLAAELGPGPVLDGLCKIIVEATAPGRLRHIGVTPFVALGERDDRKTGRVERLAALLTQAGVEVRIPDDIRRAIWEKLLFIAPVSGVSAVTRSTLGVTRSLPESREMLAAAMEEVVAVAGAQGVTLADDAVERTLRFLDGVPAGSTASMQRDIVAGLPSELEAQNGAVVRLGAAAGVPTPVNGFVYASLLPQERQARAARER